MRGDSFATPPRRPWTRRYVNQQAQRITRMFRWGVSRELVPPAVHAALKTVEALKRGRCAAREGKRVAPVPADILDTVRPFLSRPVRALVDLQLLTGARPGELLALRAVDLDTGSPRRRLALHARGAQERAPRDRPGHLPRSGGTEGAAPIPCGATS